MQERSSLISLDKKVVPFFVGGQWHWHLQWMGHAQGGLQGTGARQRRGTWTRPDARLSDGWVEGVYACILTVVVVVLLLLMRVSSEGWAACCHVA